MLSLVKKKGNDCLLIDTVVAVPGGGRLIKR